MSKQSSEVEERHRARREMRGKTAGVSGGADVQQGRRHLNNMGDTPKPPRDLESRPGSGSACLVAGQEGGSRPFIPVRSLPPADMCDS